MVEEEPSESLWLYPFKLHFYELDVLGRFPLKCLLHRAPHSTLDTTGVSSVLLPLRHKEKVMTSLCGLIVGCASPGGGTLVPFNLVEDVVAY